MPEELLLQNARVLLDDFVLRKRDIRIRRGRIAEIGSFPEEKGVDLNGKYLFPGFVESHFHGACGETFQEIDRKGIEKIAAYEAAHGITTIIPTISGAPEAVMDSSVEAVGKVMREGNTGGAVIRGIHVEGPFLSVACRGAHREEDLRKPSIERWNQLQELSGGCLRSITLAPELDGAMELIRYLNEQGITVQMGHSAADYETTERAVDAGATVSTHTFNAMVSLHHRAPGILGAVLTDDRVTCEMIGDLTHVQGPVLLIIYRCKGPDRITLVSDSMYAAGMPEGTYDLEGRIRTVRGNVAYLPNGTISGSVCCILDGVRNLVKWGVPLEHAVKAASWNPSRALRLSDRIGSIAVGKEADLVVMDDALQVSATYIGGICVYQEDRA